MSTDTALEYRYPGHGFETMDRGFETSIFFQPLNSYAPTAPKHLQRSPTTKNSMKSLKDTSKHQEKVNISLYNINMIKIWCKDYLLSLEKEKKFKSEFVKFLVGKLR
ncbi:hypothetical protein GQ457_07G017600 [Hibiscus cannabinus]